MNFDNIIADPQKKCSVPEKKIEKQGQMWYFLGSNEKGACADHEDGYHCG